MEAASNHTISCFFIKCDYNAGFSFTELRGFRSRAELHEYDKALPEGGEWRQVLHHDVAGISEQNSH